MQKIINSKTANYQPTQTENLVLDDEPTEGSFNGITSDAVAKVAEHVTTAEGDIDSIEKKIPSGASSSNKLVTESGMEDALSTIGTGYTPKGNATVATLEALTGQGNGDMYIVTDSGTLNDGALAVSAGNSVAWDSTNEVWYKTNQYATQQEHDALTTYAQNVAHSIAPEFVENSTNALADHIYSWEGKTYVAKEDYYGPWDASKFDLSCVSQVFFLEKDAADVVKNNYTKVSVTLEENKIITDQGVIIDYSTNPGYFVTDYVDVSSYDKILVGCSSDYTNAACVFYNEDYSVNKVAIYNETTSGSTLNVRKDVLVDVPSTAKYVVLAGTHSTYIPYPYIYAKNGAELKAQTDINSLKYDMSEIAKSDYEEIATTHTNRKFLGKNGNVRDIEDDSWYITDYIDVSNYDKILVDCACTYTYSACSFFYEDYSVCSVAIKNETSSGGNWNVRKGVEVTVPFGAKYVVLSGTQTYTIALPKAYHKTGAELKSQADINMLKSDMSDITQTRYPRASVTYLQKKYISDRGVIRDYDNEDYYITDYVDVSSYDKIWVDCACIYRNCAACFYYDDYSLCQIAIKNETSSGDAWNAINNAELSVPAGAKYVVLSGTNVGRNHLPVVRYKNGVIISKPWGGKKWCCVGDSLTEFNSRTSKNYFEYVSEDTGIECVNMGVSGSGYKHKSDENKAFYQRISNVPVDSDVVTIFGSGNDLNYVPSNIGTATDTGTTTLAGCINTTIDNLYAILPAVHLGIVAPTPWKSSNPYGGDTKMTQYVMLLKEICERRSIPFLDLYHCSNLRPWDDDFLPVAFSKDDGGGVHPDEVGHKLIANRFKIFVESIM